MKIKIFHDSNMDSPIDQPGVEAFFCYNRNSIYYMKPGDAYRLEKYKKQKGVVVIEISCYAHGSEQWGIRGEVFQCRWDTTQIAGHLVLSKKEFGKNADFFGIAREIMKDFSSWVNGECYGYNVYEEKPCPTCGTLEEVSIDMCAGYYGLEFLKELQEQYPDAEVIYA
jgi:hypothetical protein